MDTYCCGRPNLELIGMSTWKWFGLATQDINHEDAIIASDLEDALNNIKLRQKEESEKNSISSMGIDASDSSTIEQLNYRAMVAMTSKIYGDFKSPLEEAQSILERVSKFLKQDLENRKIPWEVDNSCNTHSDNEIVHKVKAIQRQILVNHDGSAVPLSYRQLLLYGTNLKRLTQLLKTAKESAEQMNRNIAQFPRNEHVHQDAALIQYFILDQLTVFKRYCLEKQCFAFEDFSPDPVHPISWFFAWCFVIGCMCFMILWLFLWGIKNCGVTLDSWGINFGLTVMQDMLGLIMIRLFVVHVIAIDAAKPQLLNIFRTLNNIALHYAQHDDALDSDSIRVCQHLVPTCRASRMYGTQHLASARILRCIGDFFFHCDFFLFLF